MKKILLSILLAQAFIVFAAPSNLPLTKTEASGTALQRTTSYTWDSTLRIPTSITTPVPDVNATTGVGSRVTNFTYAAGTSNASQIAITAPTNILGGGNTTRAYNMTYDTNGLLLTLKGPRYSSTLNEQLTFTYNMGRPATVTNGLGQTVTMSNYGSYGKPQDIVDENGMRYSMTYDARGRLLTKTFKGNSSTPAANFEATTYTYDNVGQVIKITAPTGYYKSMTYDTAHRLTQIDEYDENNTYLGKLVFTLDDMSNMTAIKVYNSSNTAIRSSGAEYDSQNRLYKTIDSLNQAYTYTRDGNGNVTNIKDPNNKNVGSTIDALNRVTATTLQDSSVINTAYDIADRITQVKDPKNLNTNYTYNGFNELIKLVSPDTGTTIYTYDSASNMLSQSDARGITSTNTYDVLNRLTSIVYPTTSENVTLTYDNCTGSTNTTGKLCKIIDESGTTQLSYNDKGRLSTKTSVVNGVSFTLSYSYNAKGQLTGVTYPSGKTLSYTYLNGKVSSITSSVGDIVKDINYEAFNSRFNNFKFGNSTTANPNNYTRNFNSDDYIASINSTALNNSYTFDSRYNITGINSVLAGYDDRSRITSYNNTVDAQSYTYNTSSDRLTDVKNMTTTNYTYSSNSHRLTSLNSSAITYDNNGNTLTSAGISYTYNNANRLATSNNGTVTTTYKYNALGQRVSKTTGTTITYYVYDDDQLIGEYQNSSGIVPISEHVYLNGVPVGLMQNNNLYYVYVDHINTPRAIADTSNNSVWTWENNDAFGNNQPNSSFSGFTYNLRFSGQYFDSENNLAYNYYRNYNSLTGRYMQSDPIGLNGGINTYGYVGGNPLRFNDPLGLSPKDIQIMKNLFNQSLKDMNANNIRFPGNGADFFNFNNIIAKGCNPTIANPGIWPFLVKCQPQYKSIEYCDGQSRYLSNILSGASYKFDDVWKIVTQDNGVHWWLVALSSNPNDPVVYLDAWAEEFSVGKLCSHCNNQSRPLDSRPMPRIQ